MRKRRKRPVPMEYLRVLILQKIPKVSFLWSLKRGGQETESRYWWDRNLRFNISKMPHMFSGHKSPTRVEDWLPTDTPWMPAKCQKCHANIALIIFGCQSNSTSREEIRVWCENDKEGLRTSQHTKYLNPSSGKHTQCQKITMPMTEKD